MSLEVAKNKIRTLDEGAMELAQKKLDSLTKPLGSLGVLEEIAKKIAGITGNPQPKIGKKAIIVMAGDHGVVKEGVSAFPQEVTPQMVYNFLNGGAGINVLAKHVGADVKVVDIGVAAPLEASGLISRKIKMGTDNMAKGPAMSKDEAIAAIEVGIDIAENAINEGATILGTGEMGIGNTTPSSAITAVFGKVLVEEIVGKGTGIDDDKLNQKINIIKEAIRVNEPDPTDAIDVLAKVGGLEIAGLAGVILGAAANQIPVVIDGFISGAAALVASKIAPESANYMIASHVSVEPGHKKVLELLGLKPMLFMDMRLGEGTGAALGINLVEAASKIINEMATFEGAGVSEAGDK
ncbi:nicotinate-nucleotide--dimethylbenzimidazole phosphoribosyltransferase [Candidatus Oleimmundimicrobium sp.]|uniref:nicotinate-nucleotide--dimethylbenzimidazole phosphoribosyltransferase n=1 Tax=Candidatus Oleimmundimicrobium sp. TaxID=3060597 RepID=UPI00271E2BD8|nr:nicotinate-nucleotide--dimethylbenzimidazole phosphoribosyltransferase [Candidatus Oleimmundimicrobium sp.]MDO8885295.1 nicotinate-nucleotide--dimethylbenzimidazole phosphoribosyltransferase [Candidatus Oleimmundimicrobium sp.]